VASTFPKKKSRVRYLQGRVLVRQVDAVVVELGLVGGHSGQEDEQARLVLGGIAWQ
jgi:hypothetical protein